MTIHIDRGPFIYIPDKLHPGSYKMVKNPDWNGELPDIITFTDFLRWNYTLDYGRYIRDAFEYGVLPLPWEAVSLRVLVWVLLLTLALELELSSVSAWMRVLLLATETAM